MSQSIELKDVGPITRLSLPLPDGGGVCVLRGGNGVGKTSTINALLTLCGGKSALHARDEVAGGSVEGLGAKVSVGARTRRTGEIGVATLEGKLSIGDLVEPGLVDPVAADSKRIRALLALTNAKANLSLFSDILGEDGPPLAEVLGLEAMSAEDLLSMAGLVKRDLETAARQREARAGQHKAEAAALRAAVEGLPEAASVDETALLAEMRAASAEQARLLEAAKAAGSAKQERERLRQQLRDAQVENDADPHPVDLTDWDVALADTDQNVQAIRVALRSAEETLKEVRAKKELADVRRAAGLKRSAMIERLQNSLAEATAVESPTAAALAAAQDRATKGADALGVAASGRQAAEKRRRAAEEEAKAAGFAKEAQRFRDGARAVDGVLSNAVACPELRVQAGRLVTDTARGVTPLAELSTGERWAIALRIAGRTVGKGGLIPATQEAWQALDATRKSAVAKLAHDLEVWIVTAEVTNGPLVVGAA
jgi:hypothetical protein